MPIVEQIIALGFLAGAVATMGIALMVLAEAQKLVDQLDRLWRDQTGDEP